MTLTSRAEARLLALVVVLAVCATTAAKTPSPFYPESAYEFTPAFTASPKKCTVENEEYACVTLACLPNPDGVPGYSCQQCQADSDCHGNDQVCREEDGKRECRHKPLWKPSWRDYVGTAALFVGGALAAGGGIGGGGVFVPILIFLFSFREHSAVALSSAMVFGGSLANFALNVFKKHPYANRPLIDYDVVMVMEPLTLAGAVIGVCMNVIFPDYVIVALLVIVLSLTTWRSAVKGWQTWKKESTPAEQINMANERRVDGSEDVEPPSVMKHLANPEGRDPEAHLLHPEQRESNVEIDKILKAESNQLPIIKIIVTFICWFAILAAGLLKGGKNQLSFLPHIDTCAWYYWVANVVAMAFTIMVTIYYTVGLLNRHTKKIACGYPFARGDVKWTKRNAIFYPSLYAAAGVMAGTLGIGGGMIKGPLMLEMGMIPETTAATAAFMIMFTSSATTVQFLLVGTLRKDYALYLAVVGFACTIVGQVVINYFVKKFRKSAYIIFSIVFVVGASTILLGVNGGLKVYHEWKVGSIQQFKDFCAA